MFWLKSKHAHPDIVVPGGTFDLLAQAGLGLVARVRAQDGQHQLLEQGKVLCRVAYSHLAGRGERTICAASVGVTSAAGQAGVPIYLPMIYESSFPDHFLALVREHPVARVYCPVATVYAFLVKFIADRQLALMLVGESPVAQQIQRHKELMARARRVLYWCVPSAKEGPLFSR